MKTLTVFIVTLILGFASLFAWGEVDYKQHDHTVETKITILENQLATIQEQGFSADMDWKSELRLKRAIYYYQTSKRYREANWDRQAIDQAQRGLNLIALYEKNS
jgi:hypothetical protein